MDSLIQSCLFYYNAIVQDFATRNYPYQRFPQGTSFASQQDGIE